MEDQLRVGLIQHNPTVGAVTANREAITAAATRLADAGADLVVAPELAVLGYPPQDLLHRDGLHEAQKRALKRLAAWTETGPPLVVGAALPAPADAGPPLCNAAVAFADGTRETWYAKRLLPNYDVFDERRYFAAGSRPVTVDLDGTTVGLSVCEDAWHDVRVTGKRRHGTDPIGDLAGAADVIVTLSASPFHIDKPQARIDRFRRHADRTQTPIVFVNQVGGNDELLFDGHSLVVDPSTGGVTELAGFKPDDATVALPLEDQSSPRAPSMPRSQQARRALRLGVRDYFSKTGFETAIVGMSGGIDSSVAAALAVDALGSEHVIGVTMPSAVTSEQSRSDARRVADRLDIRFHTVPIEPAVDTLRRALTNAGTTVTGVTDENLQARVRGTLLMAIANAESALVLTPDNKSESAVGYSTLYGDTVGALAPLGDCLKALVYDLAEEFNAAPPTDSPPIPEAVIDKAPSAELAPDQTDADVLPPYTDLDPALQAYIDETATGETLQETFGSGVAATVLDRVPNAEFKREQFPPVLRVTERAFGMGWRYPIAAEYDHVRPS